MVWQLLQLPPRHLYNPGWLHSNGKTTTDTHERHHNIKPYTNIISSQTIRISDLSSWGSLLADNDPVYDKKSQHPFHKMNPSPFFPLTPLRPSNTLYCHSRTPAEQPGKLRPPHKKHRRGKGERERKNDVKKSGFWWPGLPCPLDL